MTECLESDGLGGGGGCGVVLRGGGRGASSKSFNNIVPTTVSSTMRISCLYLNTFARAQVHIHVMHCSIKET